MERDQPNRNPNFIIRVNRVRFVAFYEKVYAPWEILYCSTCLLQHSLLARRNVKYSSIFFPEESFNNL